MTIQITERRDIDKFIVGIDFGTTNSVICDIHEGSVRVLAEVPSVVSILADGSFVVGKKGSVSIASVKRLLGKGSDQQDLIHTFFNQSAEVVFQNNGLVRLKVGNKFFSAVEIASAILKHLKHLAEERSGKVIEGAVVTIPAYFDNNAKKEVLLAAQLAQIEVLRVIAEPTAAAYAYGLQNKVLGQYLVFDLGGGTFDVSILKMQEGIFRVLGVSGDALLGGDDIDRILAKYLFEFSKESTSAVQDMHIIAKDVKEKLSYTPNVSVQLPGTPNNLVTISRQTLNSLACEIVNKTISITKALVASYSSVELNGILLVGGATKMPIFEIALQNAFPNTPILKDLDPDKIVAIGAAWQAHNLTHKNKDLLIDVVPLSLGVELMGGLVEVVIPRNSSVPTYATKRFTTYADGQSSMKFNIVQGERDLAKDCVTLAQFELKGIPNLRAGQPRIDVVFALDADGVLSVKSTEISTGISQEIFAKPSISDEQISFLLENAMQNIEQDFHQRLLLEAKNKAESLIKSIYKVKGKIMLERDCLVVAQCIAALSKALEKNQYEQIQELFLKLEEASASLFEETLQESIKHAVVGRSVEPKS